MVQGKNKENYSAFIALAAEGKKNSSSGLSISGNRAAFAPGVSRNSAFVADWGGARIALGQNAFGQASKPMSVADLATGKIDIMQDRKFPWWEWQGLN